MSELSDAQCDRILEALTPWPPPAKGTHSSDYPSSHRCPCADATTQPARNGPIPGQTYEAHLAEYEQAARWSTLPFGRRRAIWATLSQAMNDASVRHFGDVSWAISDMYATEED
jgi:hypothetical protein